MNVINHSPVMDALDSHISALDLLALMLEKASENELRPSWILDQGMLKRASSFYWTRETTDAVIQASRSIPGETQLNRWNLSTDAAWWYFERPLPWSTVTALGPDGTVRGIRALSMGWFALNQTWAPRFVISCYVDDPLGRYRVCPSQTWHWHLDEPISAMIARIQREHDTLYGPGGRWADRVQIGTPVFMTTATAIAHFVVAALAWLDQKIAVQDASEKPLRQRRKEFVRKTGRESSVTIVQLRRAERTEQVSAGESRKVDWSCQWVVDGHWRHVPCGEKHGDRRLCYISPFLKGPEDKPLKAKATKVYEVSR